MDEKVLPPATGSLNNNNKKLFEIRPNQALSGRGWVIFYLTLFIISFSLALRIHLMGYWLILPFVVLDMAALGGIFYMLYQRSQVVEQLVISEGQLEIHHLEKGRNRHWSFPLYWVSVRLQPAEHRWYPHRLLIGSHGTWVEVARCLTDEERESLSHRLAEAIRQFRSQAGEHTTTPKEIGA